jgi:membrane protein DedA with SNARE-associated domain
VSQGAICLWLLLGTFVSEDAACIAAGLLIHQMSLDPLAGIAACFVGIYLGDLGLWSLGRWGRTRLVAWPALAGSLEGGRMDQLGRWFDRNAPWAIAVSRVTPGTRLPLYLAAGALGRKAGPFIIGTFIAAALWTPLLVLGSSLVGREIVQRLQHWVGGASVAVLITLVGFVLVLRLGRKMSTWEGRALTWASIRKIRRWEFWPAWIFYPPVVAYVAWLCTRHRGIGWITTVNPGIPLSGIVGESKHAIQSAIAGPGVLPTALIASGPTETRLVELGSAMVELRMTWPIMLKPDAGQRGEAVRKIDNEHQARDYLDRHACAVVAQPFHPGPHEAGVFYYRLPDQPAGRIFSITDKRFSWVTGDGHSTLRRLILQDDRHVMQAATFLKRHADRLDRVPSRAERVRLAEAGNHCQGTMFRDGRRLWSPELEAEIDRIARRFEGFYFGRFDLRYADEQALRQGRDFAVIELNGVTSESTNIYDPDWHLRRAWATLFEQWSIAARIGAANLRRGVPAGSIRQVWRALKDFYARRDRDTASD